MSEFCQYVMNRMNVLVATDGLHLQATFLLFPINKRSTLVQTFGSVFDLFPFSRFSYSNRFEQLDGVLLVLGVIIQRV